MEFGFPVQKDSLMEITFHVPNSNTQFVGDENRPPAQVSLPVFQGIALKCSAPDWAIWVSDIGSVG